MGFLGKLVNLARHNILATVVVLFLLIAIPLTVRLTLISPQTDSKAAVLQTNCWPNEPLAGTLPGQPPAIWCFSDQGDGPSTAKKGTNTWVDEFDHGLTLSKFDTVNYTDFPIVGSLYKSQLFRHGNHWMRDIAGSGPGGEGDGGFRFGASMIRPNATFRAENNQLVIEAEVATRVADYGGNLFWPEVVITTGDRPTSIRSNGTYVYEAFPGHWTLGCRLQNDGGFTCAMLDSSTGGDSTARVTELSHFQCGNSPGAPYSTNYQCHSIYGGLPSNLPADVAAYSRDCAQGDPDTNCRDRWRWEITPNRLTWYANGVKYMEHTNFDAGARTAITNLINQQVYVYFGEFLYKLDSPARMHWDRIAINPKDAAGNLLPPSAVPGFCLPWPNCSGTLTPTPKPTATPTSTPTPTSGGGTPTLTPTSTPTPTPTPSVSPSVAQVVRFDDKAGQDQVLGGQYPTGVIDWGGASTWWHSSPWKLITSKSMSFNGNNGVTSTSFNFVQPRRLISADVYNGGLTTATATFSCAGQPVKSVSVAPNQLLNVPTGWTGNCASVILSTTNGWDTNFDNLSLSAVTTSTTPVPTLTPTPTPTPTPHASGDGLLAIYFNNRDLTGSILPRLDKTINFNWGYSSPDPQIGANTFSARWTGFVMPATTENYTFYARSDDGVRVWVDNKLVIDRWVNQSPRETRGSIQLTAGKMVPIKVEYYENTGRAVMELRYSTPTIGKAIVPQSILFTHASH